MLFRYAAAFFRCPLSLGPGESVPQHVSVIPACNQASVVNVLPVIDTLITPVSTRSSLPHSPASVPSSPPVLFTVCMAVLHSNFSSFTRLVETLEADRMFGARRFVVYDMSSTVEVRHVLADYGQLVEVVPWDSLPVRSSADWPKSAIIYPIEVHYFGQVCN